ncbi:MAG: hypothetical protein P9L92_11255 [Candidatus Electryonea clarkiae]|nr:hypothetical protein [Candidatus Electryonea clarkiae]MDP8287007.1 hypothetical protein [Candidatus Electryonea clarkiae]
MKEKYSSSSISLCWKNHSQLIILISLGFCMILSMFLMLSCESATSPPNESYNGDNGSNDDGNGGSSGTIWDGTNISAWQQTMEIQSDTVVLDGQGSFYYSIPLSIQNISLMTFSSNLDFSSNSQTRSLSIITHVKKSDGSPSWMVYDQGKLQISQPMDNIGLTVYQDDWKVNDVAIDSIKLKISSFNENHPVFLISPKISAI